MIKTIAAALFGVFALAAVPAVYAQSGDVRQDNKDIRQDRRDIRQDRQERREDRRELRKDVKSGDTEGARAERFAQDFGLLNVMGLTMTAATLGLVENLRCGVTHVGLHELNRRGREFSQAVQHDGGAVGEVVHAHDAVAGFLQREPGVRRDVSGRAGQQDSGHQ